MTQSKAEITILIVDDELINRKLLEILLHVKGYLTSSAANAEEAVYCIGQKRPNLILLDVMMPDTNGYELLKILKTNAACKNIPVIMVTALIDRDSRLTGVEGGADDVLTKPVDRLELWLKIKNLLRLQELEKLQTKHEITERNYFDVKSRLYQSAKKLENLSNIVQSHQDTIVNSTVSQTEMKLY